MLYSLRLHAYPSQHWLNTSFQPENQKLWFIHDSWDSWPCLNTRKVGGKRGPICSEARWFFWFYFHCCCAESSFRSLRASRYSIAMDTHGPSWKGRKEQKNKCLWLCNLLMCLPVKFQVRLLKQAFQVIRYFEYGIEKLSLCHSCLEMSHLRADPQAIR